MTHIGQEIGLDLGGRFGRFLGFLQFPGPFRHQLLQMLLIAGQFAAGQFRIFRQTHGGLALVVQFTHPPVDQFLRGHGPAAFPS